ncbi:hypothetical protein GC176_19735 [bacterium]|nr:hypothetical protein [bacterium]
MVALLCCGYVLLAVQLVLPVEADRLDMTGQLLTGGAIVWLLIPWLAAVPDRRIGILTAAVYGVAIDCLGGLHPGLLLGLTVTLTAMLQSLPWPTLLKSGPRIVASSFVCALLPAMAVTAVSLALQPTAVAPQSLVASLLIASGTGAVVSAASVSLFRGISSAGRETSERTQLAR